MKNAPKKQKKEILTWLIAISIVIVVIASSCLMASLAFFFITKSLG